MVAAGVISAIGFLFLVFKLGIRKVINYDIFFDIAITAVLLASFAGTFSGMFAAMIGGLIVSIVLFVMKRTMRHEQLMLVKTNSFPYRKITWVMVDP